MSFQAAAGKPKTLILSKDMTLTSYLNPNLIMSSKSTVLLPLVADERRRKTRSRGN